MNGLLIVLFVIAIVLLIVTFVGHGIWVSAGHHFRRRPK